MRGAIILAYDHRLLAFRRQDALPVFRATPTDPAHCATCRHAIDLLQAEGQRRLGYRCYYCDRFFCRRCAKRHFAHERAYSMRGGRWRVLKPAKLAKRIGRWRRLPGRRPRQV